MLNVIYLSPADVTIALPTLARALLGGGYAALEKGMSQGSSERDAFCRLVLQHALYEIKELVMLFGFREKISL